MAERKFHDPMENPDVDYGPMINKDGLDKVFGPVLPIYIVSDIDEAITRTNDGDFGLTSSIHTSDIGTAKKQETGRRSFFVWKSLQSGGLP